MSTKFTAAAVVVIVAIAAFDFHEVQVLQHQRLLSTQAGHEHAVIQSQIAAQRRANDRRAAGLPGGPRPQDASSPSGLTPKERQMLQASLARSALKQKVESDYGTFLDSLGSRNGVTDRLRALLIDRQGALNDASVREPLERYDGQIQTILGPNNYANFVRFENEIPAQRVLGSLQLALEFSDTQLSTQQQSALADLLTPTTSSGSLTARNHALTLSHLEISDEQMAEAARILSPSQLANLRDVRDTAARREDLRRRIAPPPIPHG